MRHTLFSTSLSLVLPTLFATAFAELLRKNNSQTCTVNAVFKGLWYNPAIAYDATTWCLSALGSSTVTTCVATTTSHTTEFPMASDTITVTQTSAVPLSTSTVFTTAVVFGIGRDADFSTPTPTMTAMPRYARTDIQPRHASSASRSSVDLTASLVSACTCNKRLKAETNSIICTSISTIYDSVITHTTTTEYVTISSGTTTITKSMNSTTSIVPARTSAKKIRSSLASAHMSATATSSSLPSRISSSVSSSVEAITASSFNSGPTVLPSGCPSMNGTAYNTGASDCSYYERICYRSYSEDDFYDAEERFSTAEECARLCDAQNSGFETKCLGIVWNTTSSGGANCRQLKSISSRTNDPDSIALLWAINTTCSTSASFTSSPASTGWIKTSPVSTTASITSSMSTIDFTTTDTTSLTVDAEDRFYPEPSYMTNETQHTQPSERSSHSWGGWSGWHGSMGTATGAGSDAPTPTSNTTCPASTVYSSTTVYLTQFMTVTPSWQYTGTPRVRTTQTVTIYGSSATVTITESAGSSLGVTKTETSTATYLSVSTVTASCPTTTSVHESDRMAYPSWSVVSLGH